MTNTRRKCASCLEYPLAQAAEGGGMATCGAYGHQVSYSEHFCVLYMPVRDRATRAPLVRKLMEQREAATDQSSNKEKNHVR